MLTNFRGFLRHLPLNTELVREFLADHVFAPESPIDWSADEPALATALADAIEGYPDPAIRDDAIAAIEQVAQLADGAGARQMLSVVGDDAAIATAFAALESPEERALWLYVNSPAKFNEAVLARHFDDGLVHSPSQRWKLPARANLELTEALQATISEVVAAFYRKRFGYGLNHKPYVVRRHVEGSLLLVIDVSDLACNRAVWERGQLRRGPLILSRTLALNYHLATGRTETIAPGGADAHHVLVNAFTEHALSQKGSARHIARQTYRLDALNDGVDIFDREAMGIEQPRLKSIAMWAPGLGLRSTFEVMGRTNRASVEALVKLAYPADMPLQQQWPIVGATIELPFYPEAGCGGEKGKTLRLRFNRKGQANLHQFTEAERQLIEPLLVEWGLVDPPSVDTAEPADATSP